MIFGKRTSTADDLHAVIAKHVDKPLPSGEALDEALDELVLAHHLLFADMLEEIGYVG